MKKFILIGLSFIFFFGSILNSCGPGRKVVQEHYKPLPDTLGTSDFANKWEKVREFREEGRPRSGMEVARTIYEKAKAEQNPIQQIKALNAIQNFRLQFEENAHIKNIREIQEEIRDAYFPLKSILESMLANQYLAYYQFNRYQIMNRSTLKGQPSKDIKIWGLSTFHDTIDYYFQKSLKPQKKLSELHISAFDKVLSGDTTYRHLRPTLFDLLAHRALKYYKSNEIVSRLPIQAFLIDDSTFFAPAEKFAGQAFQATNENSSRFQATKIYQNLLKTHLNDSAYNAIIHASIERLNFVHENSTLPEKKTDRLYYQALQHIIDRYPDTSAKADAYYEQARLVSNGYQPENYPKLPVKQVALRICDKAIEKFPKSFGAQNCKALIAQIEAPEFSITIENTYLPLEPSTFLLSYKNLDSIFYRIIPLTKPQYFNLQRNRGRSVIQDLKEIEPLFSLEKGLELPLDYKRHTTEPGLPGLELGSYAILLSSGPSYDPAKNLVSTQFFQVTDLSLINTKRYYQNKEQFFVLNAKSGEPEENVEVNVFQWTHQQQDFQKIESTQTNEKGQFSINANSGSIYIELTKGLDTFYPNRSVYIDQEKRNERAHLQTHLFTDRSIYRPGQTVHFKGILVESKNEGAQNTLKTGKEIKVQLVDANNQKIAQKSFTTTGFGSFSGDFELPSSGLTGYFRLQTPYGSQSISVEEYKRPNFEIRLPDIKTAYKVNDTIQFQGKAVSYSGVPLQNAEVTYNVERQVRFPFWYWWDPIPSTSASTITNGVTNTKKDGGFQFSFVAKPDPQVDKKFKPVFRYKIEVIITDLTGETHTASKIVRAGYNAFFPKIDMKEWNPANEKLSLTPSVTNISGKKVEKKGELKIVKLQSPDRLFRKQLWPSSDLPLEDKKSYKAKYPYDPYKNEHKPQNWKIKHVLYDSVIKGNQELQLASSELNGLKTGYYKVTYNISEGAKTQSLFKVYQNKENSVAIKDFSYLIPVKTQGEPGEKAKFIWGSAADTAHAIMRVEKKGKIIDERYLTATNGQKIIEIPIKEEHRGNLHFHLFSVNENRFYSHRETIHVPWTNKKLDITFTTFNSKLKPGKKETWKLTIKDHENNPANAELLAGMYDASLDAIKKHSWSFKIFPAFSSRLNYSPLVSFSTSSQSYYGYLYNRGREIPGFKQRTFEHLEEGGNAGRLGGAAYYMDRATAQDVVTMETKQKSDQKEEATEEKQKPGQDKEEEGEEMPNLRKNLEETAFFFPQVHTDNNGDITLEFKVPEALTRWKAMFLAHTKTLANDYLEKKTVTQKKLMVEPNPPRFLREGDKLYFSSKVSNLTGDTLQVPVNLKLLNASDRKSLSEETIKAPQEQTITLSPKETGSVKWLIEAPKGVKGLIYQVYASAKNHTDGEEDLIPVLPAKQMVTESQPLWVRGEGKQTFNFSRIKKAQSSSTLENHRVVLEMASNPTWYAIQALPSLMSPDYECTEQVFNAFFSNKLANHIMNSSPQIREIIHEWETKDTAALKSNLQKNTDLKLLSLGNTPWLEEAKNESERKSRLAQYFDSAKVRAHLKENFRKLKQWQLPNGGWPWFKGMPANQVITQEVIAGLGHIEKMGIEWKFQAPNTSILLNALDFIDREIEEDYQRIQTHSDSPAANHLNAVTVQYLYARSFYKDQPVKQEEAFDYWLNQGKKYWLSRSLMEQAMLALAFHRYGEDKIAEEIITSLNEKALHDEEMGMYWRNNEASYQWYQSPIETQALLIEAFAEINGNQRLIEAMKAWLLKQKQVQAWPTTKATGLACYALLSKGEDWLSGPDSLSIQLGDQKLSINNNVQEAGTGYFRKIWEKDEINPTMFEKIVISKQGSGIAWGAVHWQYFEKLSKITAHQTPLEVHKTLYRQVNTEAGQQLVAVNEGDSLNTGDYITIRLTIKTDRNMEFIHLQDTRAPALEPVKQLSGYRYQDGLGYYQSIRDATANFFFSRLPKGTYVFEYDLVVSQSGTFQNGTATIQSMYAPSFNSHTEGGMLMIGGQ